MTVHNENNHAVPTGDCQPNSVRAEDAKVVLSRREAMACAREIFSRTGASAVDIMIMAEAIHQFLIGKLNVCLVDSEGGSLFPVNNLPGSLHDIKDISSIGNREGGVSSFPKMEAPVTEFIFTPRDTSCDLPNKSLSCGGRNISSHNKTSSIQDTETLAGATTPATGNRMPDERVLPKDDDYCAGGPAR